MIQLTKNQGSIAKCDHFEARLSAKVVVYVPVYALFAKFMA